MQGGGVAEKTGLDEDSAGGNKCLFSVVDSCNDTIRDYSGFLLRHCYFLCRTGDVTSHSMKSQVFTKNEIMNTEARPIFYGCVMN